MANNISVLGFNDPDTNAGQSDPSATLRALDEPYQSPTLSDYGHMAATGVTSLGAGLAATGSYLNTDPVIKGRFDRLQGEANDATNSLTAGLTPDAQSLLDAPISSGLFLQHPIAGTLLKSAPMAAPVVAGMLPGGIVGDALGAGAGIATSMGVNAGMSTTQLIGDVSNRIDSASDQKLQADSPKLYKPLRDAGYSERQAKDALRDYVVSGDGKWAIAAVAGAVGGAGGLGGQVATGAATKAGGRLLNAGVNALEGGVSMGVNAGGVDLAEQQALTQAGQQPGVDAQSLAVDIAQQMGLGALLGGAHGALGKPTGQPDKPVAGQAKAVRSDRVYAKDDAEPQEKGTSSRAAPPQTTPEATNTGPQPTPTPTPTPTLIDPAIAAALAPAKPTPQSNPKPATDTAVPESPNTLQAQQQELVDGKRPVVLFKGGTGLLPVPDGMKQTKIGSDIVQYNPDQIKLPVIRNAIKNDTMGSLLGLGPVTKNDAVARVAGGETPVAVTERAPDGTELKAAAGTDQTAPTQVASLEQNKAPDSTVQVESPNSVVADRAASRAPGVDNPSQELMPASETFSPSRRVLEDTSPEAQKYTKQINDQVAKNQALAEAFSEDAPGKNNRGKATIAKRLDNNDKADAVMAQFPPQDMERNAINPLEKDGVGSRKAVLDRANALLQAAQAQGVEIPKALKSSKDETFNHSPGVILLMEAKALAGKKVPETADFQRFMSREYSLRADAANDVLAERRSQGDMKSNQSPIDSLTDETGAFGSTPSHEDTVLAKLSPDENQTDTTTEPTDDLTTFGRERPKPEIIGDAFTAGVAKGAPIVQVRKNRGQTLKDKVAAARESTANAPSEAQKIAGNYRKGQLTFDGNKVSLENPKGSIRQGVDETGRKWSVKMPGDYGYIKGTEGADGDHVDTLIGSKGETGTAYVINQKDPKTGEFDEHKVIMGVNSEDEARNLYAKSFSDGSGPSRIASVVAMPREHLQEWLKDHSATKAPLPEVHGTVEAGDGNRFTPIETTNVGDLLAKLKPNGKGTASSRLIPFLARKLQSLVGDVPVHWVDSDTINGLWGGARPEEGYLQGYYDQDMKHIVLNAEMRPDEYSPIAMHEAVHAAMADALDKDPETYRQFKALMKAFGDANPKSRGEYAMSDPHEFLAELMSNPRLQELANKTRIPEELAQELNIREFRAASLWSGVVAIARSILKWPAQSSNVLEGVMALGERLTWDSHPEQAMAFSYRLNRARQAGKLASRRMPDVSDELNSPKKETDAKLDALGLATKGVRSVLDSLPENETILEKGVKLLSNDQMRQMMEKHFGALDENNPMRRAVDTIERMGVRMRDYLTPGSKLSKELYVAKRQYEGDKGWDSFARLVDDASTFNVHPDRPLTDPGNAHLRLPQGAKDESDGAMRVWQGRSKHPELAAVYKSLPGDLQGLFKRLGAYYADQHQKRSEAVLETLLGGHDAPTGSTHSDVVARAIKGALTDDDVEHYEKLGIGKALQEASEFQKPQGFYAPKKRFGNYVVSGEHDVKTPANAARIDPDTFEFATRKEAHEFVAKTDLFARTNTAHYDPATGQKVALKDALSTAGSAQTRYRVTLERNHAEFADTIKEAKAIRQALEDAGLANIKDLDRRRMNAEVDYSLSSPQVKTLIDSLKRRDDLSAAQKTILAKSLAEASIAMKAGSRLEHSYLKRRNVQGASDDAIRTLNAYSMASSQYRSRADFAKPLDAAMKDMQDHIESHRLDGQTFARRVAHQEIEQRLYGFGSPEYQGKLAPFWQKVMTLSFWKRMMSPAHLLLHMTHPGMISGPVLGARHGFGQAYRELYRSYRDMGGVAPALGRGLKGMADVFKHDTDPTDFLDYFKSKLAGVKDSSGVLAMIKDLEETGHIHANAGFEVGHFADNATRVQAGMERVDRAFRELTSSTESINRVAEAVAAYRLELRKNGGDHDAAVRYAKDTLANTQGLYSATNAAPIFKNPALRPFLQFKQFPQMIYHLLGRNLYQAFKGDDKATRLQAARSFAGVVGTHAAMAGVLGLPLELIKAPVMLANALGVTNTSWDDIENDMQKATSNAFGPQLGEIIMHGLTRALGPASVDVHHRLGLNSLLSFGEPSTDKPEDTLNWLLDTVAGAPGSMLTDTLDASQSAMNGDWEGAFEKATPVKALADLLKAARLGVYGKPTLRGKPGLAPLGPAQVATQALGFTPADVAQYNTARWESEKDQKKLATEKDALVRAWVGTAGAMQMRAMKQISAWNAEAPASMRITAATLKAAVNPGRQYILGQEVVPRSKEILENYQRLYNVR